MQDNERPRAGQDEIDVAYVARLARLALTPQETSLFQQQLGRVVGYMRELAELDVDNVEPMAQTMPLCNVLRPDEPRPGWPREKALANAPCHDGEQFIVPKIV